MSIGTLIVFIALVLVAAIAAGVLIDTVGTLQSQAEMTSGESTQQVSDRIQVFSSVAFVSGSNVEGNVDGNIVVLGYESSPESTTDGSVVLEEAYRGTSREDEIDENVVTADGRNIIAVDGNVITEDGEDVVRESDGASVVLDEDNLAVVEASIDLNVFRDYEFQDGTIRTSSDDQQTKRNVATASGIDVTNSSDFTYAKPGEVTKLELVIGTVPGSDPIDLGDTTIQYLGPDRSTTLVNDDIGGDSTPTFDVEPIQGNKDDDILVNNGDRSRIIIDFTNDSNGLEPLSEGDEVNLSLVTGSGATTSSDFTIPSVIPEGGVVRL